ncbi:hypothetical protein Tco_1452235, partial [Tanacetum coccineum]
IQEQEHSLDTLSGQLAEQNNTVKIQQTTILELIECMRKKESEKEYLKSKVVDFIMVQNLQVQVEELKSVNKSLNLMVEELSKAHALAEATLREKNKMISAQYKKMRLLEEQSEVFYEVKSESDNSEMDLILSLQTQLKETAELVVRFSDENYFVSKEIESLKVKIQCLQTKNKVLKSKETELNKLEKVYTIKESELLKDIDQMISQVSDLLKKI